LTKIFIDTNIFIRYLVNDIPGQIDKVEELFALAERGEVKLVTGPPVFFEMAWTLKSFYRMDRPRIYECLSSILGITGLEVTDIDLLEEALESYKNTTADFSDSYVAALSKKTGADLVATFNKKHFKDLGVQLHNFTG